MNPRPLPDAALGLALATALAGCVGMGPAAAPDVSRLTAAEVAAGICQGAFTSEAVTRAYIARARARRAHNAFVTLDETAAG